MRNAWALWLVVVSTALGTPPARAQPACCLADGSCEQRDAGACTDAGGVSRTPGSTCATVLCPATPHRRRPAVAIPDNDATGIIDLLSIDAATPLCDLDLYLRVTHPFVGNLIVTLEHVDTGTTAVVYNRPGVPDSVSGCSGDGVEILLDDETAGPVEDACAAGVPTQIGRFSPNAALDAFDGESLAGVWRLRVRDAQAGNVGTLEEWGLVPGQPAIALTFKAAECVPNDMPPPACQQLCDGGSELVVAPASRVAYCYEVANAGDCSLTRHDLVDDGLGMPLSDFPYTLEPGASAFLIVDDVVAGDVVHTATWTAYNPGPVDVAQATSVVSVLVDSDGDGVPDVQDACPGNVAGMPCTDDANACTDDVCDAGGICRHEPRTGACDDGDACTSGDACAGTTCAGAVATVDGVTCRLEPLRTAPCGAEAVPRALAKALVRTVDRSRRLLEKAVGSAAAGRTPRAEKLRARARGQLAKILARTARAAAARRAPRRISDGCRATIDALAIQVGELVATLPL